MEIATDVPVLPTVTLWFALLGFFVYCMQLAESLPGYWAGSSLTFDGANIGMAFAPRPNK
jgi:hypothetical protein